MAQAHRTGRRRGRHHNQRQRARLETLQANQFLQLTATFESMELPIEIPDSRFGEESHAA